VLHTVASFTDLTGLTPPLLIEVPLPNHEVIMYMCVGGYTFCIFLQWGIFYLFYFSLYYCLFTGQSHELHPQSDKHPGIVVHICEEPEHPRLDMPPPKIIQTRRP
jgi:hypothetical protein